VEIWWKNDRSSRHRACKATPASLVTASLDASCY
jgi:hypothetical protein